MKLNIVLVEPEIPSNTGNISRTCSVIDAALHLVHPLGFDIDEKAVRRAGLDYWDKLDVTYYDSFEEFMSIHGDEPMYFFSSHAKISYTDVDYPKGVFLVFGKESVGLPRELVEDNKHRALRIPMLPTLRCLNLSNSVAVSVYEVLRQRGFENMV